MKLLKKWIALLLSCLLVLTALAGCSTRGKTLMELGDAKLSVNLFSLFLSRMKGNLCSSYSFGSSALSDSFWDTQMSADGTTYNDYYTDLVLQNAKTYLAALSLFDELGLKLPDSYTDEIDAEMEELLNYDAEGSKTRFNEILKPFGVNYDLLREAYIIEAKIEYLKLYLYGENGSKVGSNLVESYFRENYARFKHVFFYTYRNLYETDANGDAIYYKEDGRISYDKSAIAQKDGNGEYVRDAKGDVIYLTEEGKIAYDKKNGARQPLYAEDGSTQLTENFSEQEIRETIDLALSVQLKAEEAPASARETVFDQLVATYNEDESMETYPNGYYMTVSTDYASSEVVEELFKMEVGDVSMVRSDYGIHVMMRYELDEGAYADEANEDFFINQNNGTYLFMSTLINQLYGEYLKPYAQNVLVDEERLKGLDMKSVGANFYY